MADAEDAVQNGFIRLMKSPQQFENDPVPILYQAVKWAALDLIRQDGRRRVREEASAVDSETEYFFENRLEKEEEREAIEKAMKTLPEEQREVLVLKIWGELGFREIGEALGVSINTAASRYRYALKKLGLILEQKEDTA